MKKSKNIVFVILLIIMVFLVTLLNNKKTNLIKNEDEKIFNVAIIFNETGLGDIPLYFL